MTHRWDGSYENEKQRRIEWFLKELGTEVNDLRHRAYNGNFDAAQKLMMLLPNALRCREAIDAYRRYQTGDVSTEVAWQFLGICCKFVRRVRIG